MRVDGRDAGGGEAVDRNRDKSFARATLEWARALVVATSAFLLFRSMGIEAYKIPTSSMENTLMVGDFLLVNKAVYGPEIPGTHILLPGFAEPKRGEVIVFHPPHEPEKNYVKRIVGVPGDTVEMRDKVLRVNGRAIDEPYARQIDPHGDAVHPAMTWQKGYLIASPSKRGYHPSRDTWGPIAVPKGHYFVLGDNRDNSEDSRYWGFVDRDQIRGRPWMVYYSYDHETRGSTPWLTGVRWNRIGTLIR
jgi:signal peptidase I